MRRDELNDALWSMPSSERMAVLVCSVFDSNKGNNAFAAVKGVIGLVSVMSRYLSVPNKFKLAEMLRDAADAMERQPCEVKAN
jgi:hypothetical protein